MEKWNRVEEKYKDEKRDKVETRFKGHRARNDGRVMMKDWDRRMNVIGSRDSTDREGIVYKREDRDREKIRNRESRDRAAVWFKREIRDREEVGYKRESSEEIGYKRESREEIGYKRESREEIGYKRESREESGYKRGSREEIGYKRGRRYIEKRESRVRQESRHKREKRDREQIGNKKTFFCDLCLIPLSSIETKNSHMTGVKHNKKWNDVLSELMNTQGMSEEKAMKVMPVVRLVPNPVSLKTKVPTRLHTRISETKEPVVGLKFITEFLPETDREQMEPHYQCQLCGAIGESTGMLGHIMGGNHRKLFIARMLGDDSSVVNMSKASLMRMASDWSENQTKLSNMISTIWSDAEYPWPAGKAPWAREMGGDGIPPTDEARGGDEDGGWKVAKQEGKSSSHGLAGMKHQYPGNYVDAMRMAEVGSMLVTRAMEYSGSGMREREKLLVKTALVTVKMKLTKNLKVFRL